MPGTNEMVFATVDSLLSLCVHYVVKNIARYTDDVKYLPPQVKNVMLNKFTSTSYYWRNDVNFKSALKNLVHARTRHADLSMVEVDDEILRILRRCRSLRELCLTRYIDDNITSQGLGDFLGCLKNLISLEISNCSVMDDEVMKKLSDNCPSLKEIDICGCTKVTDVGVIHLAKLKGLIGVTLSFTQVSDEGVQKLVEGDSKAVIKELRLANCKNISSSVLNLIAINCPKLEVLVFYNLSVNECADGNYFGLSRGCFSNLKQLTFTVKW